MIIILILFFFFFRIQEMDDGFFEKFGSQLKESVETKETIKKEENRERENYLEEDSSEDRFTISDLPLDTEITHELQCNVSS